VGFLWDYCDATAADQQAVAIVRAAVVNQDELTWFAGATAGQKAAALYALAQTQTLVGRPSA
jgi:hypothetical protein